jgi:hypothetical protein
LSARAHGPEVALARLAGTKTCSVLRCPCGCYHVNVGATTVRVAAGTLRELAEVLREATLRIEAPSHAGLH